MDMFLEEYRTGCMTEVCAFCKREVPTRGHHVVPRCKGGRDTAPTLPLLRGFHPQNLDAQRTARYVQYRRENPSRSPISEVPLLAIQAAGHRLFPDLAKPVQNQSAVPVISRSEE